jgi:hypothetical protein
MYSLKQFRGKAEELGDLAIISDDRPSDSPTRHAIDTWESEGGGSAVAVGGFDAAHTALSDIADWRANNNADWLPSRSDGNTFKNDDAQALVLANEEDRILRCLGAAVMMRWNTLPTKLQRELFDTASSVGELLQAGALKGQIARFLHKHKDDDR